MGASMGFRVRKSFKIAPGIRMTVTPKSVGLSAGVKGARISANSSGRVTRRLSIPGSGISRTKTLSSPAGRSAAPATPARPAPAPKPPAPGLFAPKWEKELHKAVIAQRDPSALARIGNDYEPARPLAALFEATLAAAPAGDTRRAIDLLSWLFSTGYDPAKDEFFAKFLPAAGFRLSIADGIDVVLPPDRDSIGLMLAELHQEAGDIPAAVDVVEQLEPSTITAVSLAEVYIEQQRWADVVDLTEGLANDDEAATYLLIQRGIAFR
jgi:hypothetical protein